VWLSSRSRDTTARMGGGGGGLGVDSFFWRAVYDGQVWIRRSAFDPDQEGVPVFLAFHDITILHHWTNNLMPLHGLTRGELKISLTEF